MLKVAVQPTKIDTGGLHSFWTASVFTRVCTLLAILAAENLAIACLDHPWFKLHQVTAAPIAFGAGLLFFGRSKLRASPIDTTPLNRTFLLLHGTCAVLWAISEIVLLQSSSTSPSLNRVAILMWFASIAALGPSLFGAFLSARRLARIAKTLIVPASYAALTTIAAMAARTWIWKVWNAPGSRFGQAIQSATFSGVKLLLGIFYPTVVAQPGHNLIGTPRYTVDVAGACSGIEGLLLMLVLTLGWLIFVRKEVKIMRAAWLVPIALAAIWLLNLVRIATLIAIGDAGHPDVAMTGFHSEAGWLMFNLVALGFLLSAQYIPWLQKTFKRPVARDISSISHPQAAVVYLAPFMAILAASLLSQAVSSGFEWLYPLRFAAALTAFWTFRSEYKKIDWRFDWLGPIAGVIVFALWLAASRLAGQPSSVQSLAAGLAHLPPWGRISWLIVRCTAAVVTVPIAEELAFRGFVARRVMASGFESVPFTRLSPLAIGISSVAFGLLHGRMWLAGVLSGIVFAVIAKVRGRLGEAVAAHATANLLLTAWAIASGNYAIW
jgi:exosortase E/protease (VPEID-CTERM system)